MEIKLTICVCTLLQRRETFLPRILDQLECQLTDEVELLIMMDNKKRSLGKKRSDAINQAQGEYMVFVDDDDKISSVYVHDILNAINNNDVDTICYKVDVSINGGEYKTCTYDMNYEKDYNSVNTYHRLPNHICCTKLSLMKEVGFKDITFGEDADYAKRLKPLLKSQYQIDKVLYWYDYNTSTTTTRNN